MNELQYVKASHISLRSDPRYDEQWLEGVIANDPGVLSLGELGLIERQRQQERAGRLDLLLEDYDQNRRFEVELMLGPTDESHIIRSIEYWDIERRRYPAYDHVAVLVAEDITARFLSLLTLFAGTVPLVAIQLNALQIGETITLDFVKVIDQRALRTDDDDVARAAPTDRAYWEKRAEPETVRLVDQLVDMVNEKAEASHQAKYNKFYIGLSDGHRVNNFVTFSPKKKYTYVAAKVEEDGWVQRFEDSGLEAQVDRDGKLQVKLNGPELAENRDLVAELLHAAADGH